MSMSHTTLKAVLVGGGIISLGGAVYFTTKIKKDLKDSEPYKKSLKLLRDYPVAVQYMGVPIKSKNVDLGDADNNFIKNNRSQFIIPLKGPKGKGTLFTWASREKAGDSWNIDRLDLELEKYGKRWTFYENPAEFHISKTHEAQQDRS